MHVCYIKVHISTKMHILSMTVCGLEIECLSNAQFKIQYNSTCLSKATCICALGSHDCLACQDYCDHRGKATMF